MLRSYVPASEMPKTELACCGDTCGGVAIEGENGRKAGPISQRDAEIGCGKKGWEGPYLVGPLLGLLLTHPQECSKFLTCLGDAFRSQSGGKLLLWVEP